MSSRQWVLYLGCLTVLLATSCSDDAPDSGGDWTNVCIDADGDGYGLQCPAGSDCDDSDRNVHAGCAACAKPAEGCACDPGTAAIDCIETPEVTSTGSLLCKEGTRYCRDGKWSGCEGLSSFTAPSHAALEGLKLHALLESDGGTCGPCAPDCYEVEDPISRVGMDGGGLDGGLAWGGNGGITIGGSGTEAGVKNPDEITPVPPCNTAADKDCDGIPDALDPFPSDKPFESDHQTIFMDLAPGQSGTNTFDLRFYLKTADVYFLLDMTGSMSEERAALINSLKSGNYLNDPSTPADESTKVECADTDFDTKANNELKDAGIAGNIACLIRNAGLGAGWYREVPYSSRDSYGIEYAYPDLEPYENVQDIAYGKPQTGMPTPVELLNSALGTFVTRGNQNLAESAGVALSAVATGGPIYTGWDRPGVPARTCPSGHFGYPCFRSDAMPIVVLVTDAPMMNGPKPAQGNLGNITNQSSTIQPVNYDALGLAYTNHSSDAQYHPVIGNENFGSAFTIPDVHTTFKTYTGNTRGMAADIHTANLGISCPSFPATTAASPGYPDAVFKFSVTDASKKVTISTRGTRFKPSLAVVPVAGDPSRTVAASGNATSGTATDVGVITSFGQVTVTGSTESSTFNSGEVTSGMVSACTNQRTPNTAPDAWFKFTVQSDINNVPFRLNTGYDAILGVWAGQPSGTPSALACTVGGGTFTLNLKANTTYYMAVRGDQTSWSGGAGRGPYQIEINASTLCAYDNTSYSSKTNPRDDAYDLGAAEIVDRTFPVGDYYIVLKGKDDLVTQAAGNKGRGWYQLTVGDSARAVNNQTAVMPEWGTATSGIQKDLVDRGIRVITVSAVLSPDNNVGANTALTQQADIVSQTTKAILSTETTRPFDISTKGAGMGFSVVNAIAKLTNNLSMDVSVRFVPLPDKPSKPFIFSSRAIDVEGDSCEAPVDTDGDNIPDTHKQCRPGAVPRFQITITNPSAPNNVPPNPAAGSNGGYNMRIEMVGDAKYVIDSTPVFIIPADVVPDPPAFTYDSFGTYVQDIGAACSGTDRPNWQYLQWDDSLPADTSLVWRVCAGESTADLDKCQSSGAWSTIATVTTRAAACTPAAPCASGYCAVSQCHFPVSPAMSCTSASDCGTPATCESNVCKWTENPISMLPALRAEQNGKRMLRLQIQLNSSPDRLRAPSISSFKVKYTCAPGV